MSAVVTLAYSQSLLSMSTPCASLAHASQSCSSSTNLSLVDTSSGGVSSYSKSSEFKNNNASSQFDGFNKQRFVLLTPPLHLNKPALLCCSRQDRWDSDSIICDCVQHTTPFFAPHLVGSCFRRSNYGVCSMLPSRARCTWVRHLGINESEPLI